MYVSHPVRRVREEPVEGAEVGLVVEFEDGADGEPALREAVADVGGEFERDLGYGAYLVRVAEPAVDGLLGALSGVERVETDAVVGVDAGDAGEDVE